MWWLLQLLATFSLFLDVLAESKIIVERWVNGSDVITFVPFTTMTSCQMGCLRTVNCATIGFKMNPEKTKNELCKFLKTKGVVKRRDDFISNFISMYLLLTVDEINERIKPKELTHENETKNHKPETCLENSESYGENNVHFLSKEEGIIWKRIDLINKEQPVTRNNLLTTLEKVTRQFIMHIEVKLTEFGREEFSNIVQFTKGGNKDVYGDRTPAIFFRKSIKNFQISSAVNGKIFYNINTKGKFSFGTWNSIQVSQLKQNNGYNYSITINGKLCRSIINGQPGSFDNVKVFASNKFHLHQPSYIRALWIKVLQNED